MTSMPLSYLKNILDQAKLDEITQESIEKESEAKAMEEKDEKEGKQGKEPVPSDKGMEKLPQETDRGKGTDLSVLRKKDKNSSTAPRRRKSGKLPESESK